MKVIFVIKEGEKVYKKDYENTNFQISLVFSSNWLELNTLVKIYACC